LFIVGPERFQLVFTHPFQFKNGGLTGIRNTTNTRHCGCSYMGLPFFKISTMNILLHSQKKICEVQNEFQKQFSYLKLEFFKRPHKEKNGSAYLQFVSSSLPLVAVSGVVCEGTIELNPGDIVGEVEKEFQQKYFLPVQVFRKCKDVWLETITSDHLTLNQQNELGRQACENIFDEQITDTVDWDAIT
jgi:hypothetical protein